MGQEVIWKKGALTVQVKPIDAPFGPSYDLECADRTKTEEAAEIKFMIVRIQHFGITSQGQSSNRELIHQMDVNVTNAEPTVIHLTQVNRCFMHLHCA